MSQKTDFITISVKTSDPTQIYKITYVFYELGPGFLNIIYLNFSLQMVKHEKKRVEITSSLRVYLIHLFNWTH
jgi:hypothetical protein